MSKLRTKINPVDAAGEWNLSTFKTWYDKIADRSDTDRMLTRIPKAKHDTTREMYPGCKRKTPVTVWGDPKSYDYVRG